MPNEPLEFEVDEESYESDLEMGLTLAPSDIAADKPYVMRIRTPGGSPYAINQLVIVTSTRPKDNGDYAIEASGTDPLMEELKLIDMIINDQGSIYVRDADEVYVIGYFMKCETLNVIPADVVAGIDQLRAAFREESLRNAKAPTILNPQDSDVAKFVYAAVTADLSGERESFLTAYASEYDRLDPSQIAAVAIGNVSNMVKLLAAIWECPAEEAWRVIQETRYRTEG